MWGLETSSNNMASIYRIVYSTKGPQASKAVNVSATTVANAIAAVKTADPKYIEAITITERPSDGGLIVGS
jgi:hypothetical protein